MAASSTPLSICQCFLFESPVCLQLDHLELWSPGNLSRDIQLVLFLFDSFPCDAGGKTRKKDSRLQLGSHRGSVCFLQSLGIDCWDTLPSSARLELFEDIISSFNCFKLTMVILLKLSLSFLKTGASFFIFLDPILIFSIMKQKNINTEGCCY